MRGVFYDLKTFLTFQKTKIIKIIAITGRKRESTLIIIEVPVSTVATTGFAKPPVVAVEASLVEAVVPLITDAVPPPAIIANAHVVMGDKSATVATITAVPAIVANGIAIVSNKLSNHGM